LLSDDLYNRGLYGYIASFVTAGYPTILNAIIEGAEYGRKNWNEYYAEIGFEAFTGANYTLKDELKLGLSVILPLGTKYLAKSLIRGR